MLKRLIRKSKGKRKNQIKHARKRFEARFDISLNENQYVQLVNRIKKGKAEFVRRQSNRNHTARHNWIQPRRLWSDAAQGFRPSR